MSASVPSAAAAAAAPARTAAPAPAPAVKPRLSILATGFGTSAVVTILFNTVLALVKDSSPPLNELMTKYGHHHWIAHGVLDVGLFLLLGIIFSMFGKHARGGAMAFWLFVAVVLGAGGLGAWFVFAG